MLQTFTLLLTLVASLQALPIFPREVPQEHSHEPILTATRKNLNLNNPDEIADPVFALLGNAAAADGAGKITDTDCLQQAVADRAFSNAKAAGSVQGMVDALIFRALERNSGKVGQTTAACTSLKAVNPEIAAIQQHQDPASTDAAAVNKAIALELARQIKSVGGNPLDALKSGTFAPGDLNDPTGKGKACNDINDPEGCIFTQNLLVPDASEDEILAAVNGVDAGTATATASQSAATTTTASETATATESATTTASTSATETASSTTASSTETCSAATVTVTAQATATVTVEASSTDGSGASPTVTTTATATTVTVTRSHTKAKSSTAASTATSTASESQTSSTAASSTSSSSEATKPAAGSSATASSTSTSSSSKAKSTATFAAGNLQRFSGNLGGAPPVVRVGDRGFVVEGSSSFLNVGAAIGRSCDIQHNKCANLANSAQGRSSGLSVGQCDQQNTACRAANA